MSTYWDAIRERAAALGTDGCTAVADVYVDCCYEHDLHWRTGRTLDGLPITYAEANARFRRCIQSKSPLGRLSPMAWWRWAGVSLVGLWRQVRQGAP